MAEIRVADVMTTDVLAFPETTAVRDAAKAMAERGVDGAPVVDADGRVVGLLSTGDLIVQDAELHLPTVVAIFGTVLELPWERRRFDEEIHKALGGTVAEVMAKNPVTVSPDATVTEAATRMHDHNVSRLPVVDADGRLVGIIARGDILRTLVRRA